MLNKVIISYINYIKVITLLNFGTRPNQPNANKINNRIIIDYYNKVF